MSNSRSNNSYIVLALIAMITVLGLVFLMQREDEPSTRLGKAVEEVGDGLKDAGRELDPHRTTGEKIGDAIEDVGDSIEDTTEK